VAASVGTNVSELTEVAEGRVPPTLSDRTGIVKALIAAKLIGRAVGDYSDPYGPGKDGVETLGNRRQRQAGEAPRYRGER
jgi:hypothetical protein